MRIMHVLMTVSLLSFSIGVNGFGIFGGFGTKKKEKSTTSEKPNKPSALAATGGGLMNNNINNEEIKTKIHTIRSVAENALKKLMERWKIVDFPNFLRSVAMSQTSWEVLKVKYQLKILKAMQQGSMTKKEKFVISFMGSSVTAGHDTQFNITVSELARTIMHPAFEAAGIQLEVINSAMGNNPCLPYDACVRTFAGPEADIVHWEQSYNCFGNDGRKRVEFEQFIRQSMSLPSHPIVVFTTSATPNWEEKDCQGKHQTPAPRKEGDDELVRLLSTNSSKIPLLNKGDEHHWSALLTMFQAYKMAGIQMWHHEHYEAYKCLGPYVKEWACCSASWHPSILGHELRASHFSFFWLLIFKDALLSIEAMLTSEGSLAGALQKVQKHYHHEHKHTPPSAMYPSRFSDDMRCLTTYEPRADPQSHLLDYVLLPNSWKSEILEWLSDKATIEKARKMGYKDFKYMIYGNKESGPLSLKITVKKTGTVFLCQPPGVWGKLPDKFKNFWEGNTTVYLTSNIPSDAMTKAMVNITNSGSMFVFNKMNATRIHYTNHNPTDTQTICVDFNLPITAGIHALTIVPSLEENIMISTILLP